MRVAIAPSGGHEARDVPSRARPGSNDIDEKVDTARGVACNSPASRREMMIHRKHIECFGSEAMQASDGRADLNLCYYFKRQGRRKHRGANTECCNTAKLLTSSPGHKALAYML